MKQCQTGAYSADNEEVLWEGSRIVEEDIGLRSCLTMKSTL
jgi:hypothetical protein